MKVNKIILLTCLVAGLFLFTQSCKKYPENTQKDYNIEMLTIKNSMYPQQFANQFMLTFFKASYDSLLINTGSSKIDSAKSNLTTFGDTSQTTIEYWYSGSGHFWHHIDSYGHYRMGTYSFITDTNYYKSTEGVVEIEIMQPFYFDSLLVNLGNIHIEKTGISTGGNQTFHVVFDHIIMDGFYAQKFTWRINAEFDYELFKINPSPYLKDNDYFLFSGTISGNSPTGINYATQISPDTARYKIDCQCRYTTEGKSTLTLSGDDIKDEKTFLSFISSDGCANYFEITFPETFTTKSPIE